LSPQAGRGSRGQARLTSPTMNSRTTAPITAVRIVPSVPAAKMPIEPSSHPPMIAPTMPTMMLPMTPKPRPFMSMPAIQPAIAPMTSQMIRPWTSMGRPPLFGVRDRSARCEDAVAPCASYAHCAASGIVLEPGLAIATRGATGRRRRSRAARAAHSVALAPHGRARAADQEVEVGALVGLLHGRAVELDPAALGVRRQWPPFRAAPGELGGGHVQLERARVDVERDAIAALDERERAARRGLGCRVQHDGAIGGA